MKDVEGNDLGKKGAKSEWRREEIRERNEGRRKVRTAKGRGRKVKGTREMWEEGKRSI